MEKEKFERFFQKEFQPNLNFYRTRASRNRRHYISCQTSVIILSGLNAILIALEQTSNWTPVKILTIMISTIIAALAAFMQLSKFQEKWALYYKASVDLQTEYYIYMAEGDEYSEVSDKERHFVTKVSNILRKVSESGPGTINPPSWLSESLPSSETHKRVKE